MFVCFLARSFVSLPGRNETKVKKSVNLCRKCTLTRSLLCNKWFPTLKIGIDRCGPVRPERFREEIRGCQPLIIDLRRRYSEATAVGARSRNGWIWTRPPSFQLSLHWEWPPATALVSCFLTTAQHPASTSSLPSKVTKCNTKHYGQWKRPNRSNEKSRMATSPMVLSCSLTLSVEVHLLASGIFVG